MMSQKCIVDTSLLTQKKKLSNLPNNNYNSHTVWSVSVALFSIISIKIRNNLYYIVRLFCDLAVNSCLRSYTHGHGDGEF